jgi:hypothetical protein
VYILSAGFNKSQALYKTLQKEEEMQDGEASVPILKYFPFCHVFI